MNIIFHHPLPINKNAQSASGIRPLRMLTAFVALGFHVDVVSGYSSERKKCIARIKDKIRRGFRYEFVYSESSTMPTILTDSHHFPLHPYMDFSFFLFCKKNNIPIGLFYRDIYWLFDGYGQGMNPFKSLAAKAAYWFDLWVYNKTLTKFYLPSAEMGKYIPWVDPDIFQTLPPGHGSPDVSMQQYIRPKQKRLKLFYVGGMSSHYQLHKLFTVVLEMPDVELTLCTREAEWQAKRHEYPLISSNIKIIHETGEAMEDHLQAADMAVLFVKPQKYWEFAAPVKLYEYLGYCKPILASEGTLSGRFVREHGIGWTIPYEEKDVKKLLNSVLENPRQMSAIRLNMQRIAGNHSWQARAEQVMKELSQ